jgi:glutamine amidotransferase
MSAKKTIDAFLKARKEYPDGYAMFHARYATHGVKNDDNCHPFKVGGDDRTYLAHNGILDIDIHATDKRSDTRVFAEDTLPKLGGVSALDDDNIWTIISKWSSGSKIAILTVDTKAMDECYIINENAGHWDNDGIWWSNNTYKQDHGWTSYYGTPAVLTTGKSEYEDAYLGTGDDYACTLCGAFNVESGNPYYCDTCMTCFECYDVYGQGCLCWTPEKDKYASSKKGYYNGAFDF